MKYLLALMLIPLLLAPAFAESPEDYEQILSSENGTLNIGLTVDPPAKANEVSKLHIGWIKPGFNKIQEHIDYRITVIKDGQNTFGPIPLTHTSIGTVKIPVEFTSNGEHQIKVEMEGILFQPIPLETTYFTIEVGEEQPIQENNERRWRMSNRNCSIWFSEMAPEVQFLREIRDNTVMTTQSGTSIHDRLQPISTTLSHQQLLTIERENPVFKEAVKVTLTPMLTSLTLLNYVEVDTDEEMLGYGISIILLNVGMYFVAPAAAIVVIKKKL